MDRKKRKPRRLRILTGMESLGEVNNNRRFRSFRLRSGWTGKEREKYIPHKHRCSKCGGRLSMSKESGLLVECKDCYSMFKCDWSDYSPGVVVG